MRLRVAQLGQSASTGAPYAAVRDRYLALNIALNLRGLTAPAFRPVRRLRNKNPASEEEELLGLDRQVIDLHYLHANHRSVLRLKRRDAKALFKPEEFDFTLAGQFALQPWRASAKSRILQIPDLLQVRLMTYRSDAIRMRWQRAEKAVQNAELALQNHVHNTHGRFKAVDIEARVDELLALRLADNVPAHAALLLLDMPRHAVERAAKETLSESETKALREKMRRRIKLFESALG